MDKKIMPVSTRNVSAFLKILRGGKDTKPLNDKETANYNYAKLVVEAETFVKNYIKKNGTKSFICERLRNGFIGELVKTADGTTYVQTERGKPYGTVVAVPTADSVAIATTYIDNEDKDKGHPIIGEYIALKKILSYLEDAKKNPSKNLSTSVCCGAVKGNASKQIKHFTLRAKAFFHPEHYSYSRGTEKVVYENYDEIHKRREAILNAKK